MHHQLVGCLGWSALSTVHIAVQQLCPDCCSLQRRCCHAFALRVPDQGHCFDVLWQWPSLLLCRLSLSYSSGMWRTWNTSWIALRIWMRAHARLGIQAPRTRICARMFHCSHQRQDGMHPSRVWVRSHGHSGLVKVWNGSMAQQAPCVL